MNECTDSLMNCNGSENSSILGLLLIWRVIRIIESTTRLENYNEGRERQNYNVDHKINREKEDNSKS